MSEALRGRRILVTRPAGQADELAQLIAARGGQPLRFPLLEIAAADDPAPLQQAIERLDEYAMAIFISPNAVRYSLPSLLARRRWPETLEVAAIGPGTAAALAGNGLAQVIVASFGFDSEALLAQPQLQSGRVAGKTIMILRGNDGRAKLAEVLRERGARVEGVVCYRRSAPSDVGPLVSLLRNSRIDALTISSSEGLRRILPLLDTDSLERLCATPVFVPHQRMATIAAELGCKKVVLTAPADAGIIEGLCAYNWLDHE